MQVTAPPASLAAANAPRSGHAPTSYERWTSTWNEASTRFQQAEHALTSTPRPDLATAVSKAREGLDLIRAGWVTENPELQLGITQGSKAWELAGWVPEEVAKLERIAGAGAGGASDLASVVSALGSIQSEIGSVTDSRLSGI